MKFLLKLIGVLAAVFIWLWISVFLTELIFGSVLPRLGIVPNSHLWKSFTILAFGVLPGLIIWWIEDNRDWERIRTAEKRWEEEDRAAGFSREEDK